MSVPPAVQIVDDTILKSQLKAMDFKALCGDTQDMSVADIIERMTRSKADAEELKRRNAPPVPYVPPGGWKEKGSLRLTKVVAPTHRTEDHSINRFHLPMPKWDRDQFPDALMVKELYRTPCRDPSGSVIFNLGRAGSGEAPLAGSWCPAGRTLRPLPPSSSALCSKAFRGTLVSNAETATRELERNYAAMADSTDSQRTLKARVGADLSNLQRNRDDILRDISKNEEYRLFKHNETMRLRETYNSTVNNSPNNTI